MQRIEALLTELQTALRKGDFSSLPALSAELETVLIPKEAAALRRAAHLSRETGELIAASLRGVRAGLRRVDALRAGTTLTTYDNSGRRVLRGSTPPETTRI